MFTVNLVSPNHTEKLDDFNEQGQALVFAEGVVEGLAQALAFTGTIDAQKPNWSIEVIDSDTGKAVE
jgi:hypothetical protein